MKYLFLLLVVFSSVSCKKDEDDLPEPKYPLILVVVENNLFNNIQSQLQEYIDETARGDSSAKVISWSSSNSAKSLRDTLYKYYSNHNIIGAFLVGDIPYVQYEMDNWDKHEEFPTDLYYSSPQTSWTDGDGDNIYDGYSSINVLYAVSRIMGTETEIKAYFSKIHSYRTATNSIPKKGYIFIDDEWSDFYATEQFGFNNIYSTVDIDRERSITTSDRYRTIIGTSGAQYIQQMIHASPSTLFIENEGTYTNLVLNDIVTLNPKVQFYNLFNCSACKFNEDNLGMTYLMKTSYGLAVMGTTKTGGNYYPHAFNQALASGKSWGESFVYWWKNGSSVMEDKWYMGMVIFGDPLLRIDKTSKDNAQDCIIPTYQPLDILNKSMFKYWM